jgi:hypothetical protein
MKPNQCFIALASFFLANSSHSLIAQERKQLPRVENSYQVQWNLMIPMRDGKCLSAHLYRPSVQKGPLPVILAMTPYTAAENHKYGAYFAKNGYIFVAMDVRGRGASEGDYEPFVRDGRDGHDAVEWLAKQSWCNGKVAMWGGSYLGFAQWATVKEFPEHLVTIVPRAAVRPGLDFPFHRGCSPAYPVQWLASTAGRTNQWAEGIADDETFWMERFDSFGQSGRAFRDLDRWVGTRLPLFQKWLDHPTPDSYWKADAPTPADYRKLHLPILTITGHYDDDQPGALSYYRDHLRFSGDDADHYLVMGPWDHHGTGVPGAQFEGVEFGPASQIDVRGLNKAWYDWIMKGGPKPEFLKKRVAMYVQGEDAWRYADRLEDLTASRRQYFLHSDGQVAATTHAGNLSEVQPGSEWPDTVVYDPLDPKPIRQDRSSSKDGMANPNGIELTTGTGPQFFDSALTYQTEPLAEPITLIGAPAFMAWVRMDVPDTDLFAALFEVFPDGRVVALSQDKLRTRYRESPSDERLVTPGKPTRIAFDQFTTFARRIAKGSRLKVVFGCITSAHWQRNHNSGKAVADETVKDAHVAHVELMHDADHPSVLEIPVGR